MPTGGPMKSKPILSPFNAASVLSTASCLACCRSTIMVGFVILLRKDATSKTRLSVNTCSTEYCVDVLVVEVVESKRGEGVRGILMAGTNESQEMANKSSMTINVKHHLLHVSLIMVVCILLQWLSYCTSHGERQHQRASSWRQFLVESNESERSPG